MLLKQFFAEYGVAGAALLAAMAFVARQSWSVVWETVADRRMRARFIAALYAEITYNTRDLKRFLATAAPPEAIDAALRRNESKALHMTDARHTKIYALSVERLSLLPQIAILDVVAFYAQLEKIKVQVDAIGQQSFREISDEGRLQVLRTLWRAIEDGRFLGEMALFRFESEGKLAWAVEKNGDGGDQVGRSG